MSLATSFCLLVNGQWSMVNACTPQGGPILGTGGEKKNYIIFYLVKNNIMKILSNRECHVES